MPNIDEYAPGQYAVQDNQGNWVSFGGDRQAAERNYNDLMGYTNQPIGSAGLPAPVIAPATGGADVSQMRAELSKAAGYPWPGTDAQVVAEWTRLRNASAAPKAGLSSLAQLLGVSLPESNQMNLDWSKEQYGKSLAEQIREFDAQLALQKEQEKSTREGQERSLYSSLVQGLAGYATQLAKLPANWGEYLKNISFGRNIFNSLYGSTPVPTFGAPSGFSEPNSLEQVLRSLGMIGGSTGAQSAMSAATAPITGESAQVPLPHQINPIVWNSLSPTAKQMIWSSAEAGNTPSGVWTQPDFEAQRIASLPQGLAPRRINYNFAQPSGYF